MTAAGKSAIEVLEKHGIKPNKTQKQNVVVEERAAEINKEIREEKGPSRNDLMLKAKASGIKNFRILNKEELKQVLDPGMPVEAMKAIVDVAIARWKSGFGNRSKAVTNG